MSMLFLRMTPEAICESCGNSDHTKMRNLDTIETVKSPDGKFAVEVAKTFAVKCEVCGSMESDPLYFKHED